MLKKILRKIFYLSLIDVYFISRFILKFQYIFNILYLTFEYPCQGRFDRIFMGTSSQIARNIGFGIADNAHAILKHNQLICRIFKKTVCYIL